MWEGGGGAYDKYLKRVIPYFSSMNSNVGLPEEISEEILMKNSKIPTWVLGVN